MNPGILPLHLVLRQTWRVLAAPAALIFSFFSQPLTAAPGAGHPDFLIRTWLNGDGIPDNSALAVAQTPDGYLWVGTGDGLLRFDGVEFTHAGQATNLHLLKEATTLLAVDHSGRLWNSTLVGLAVYEKGVWRKIEGTNAGIRSIVEDGHGKIWVGGSEGTLYSIKDYRIEPERAPEGLTPSGVFCLMDAGNGDLWLANRGFIGRHIGQGWQQIESKTPIRPALLAAPARTDGIWIYAGTDLKHYHANGTVETYPAPYVDLPRGLLEDHNGDIWIASTARGLSRFKPGSRVVTAITATNGLVHNTTWCVTEDREGNIWAGSSSGGLSRLRRRQFFTISTEDGLPDQIVRTVAQEPSDDIIVGTHGGGTARIRNDWVVFVRSTTNANNVAYAWSVLGDKSGRTWTGTYTHGLWVEENGVERSFPLPPPLGRTIYSLFEDSHGRILIGTISGLGVIENHEARAWAPGGPLADVSVRAIAEDPSSGAIWIGTFSDGLFKLDGEKVTHVGRAEGLPGVRVSCLSMDSDGCLWAGIYEKGLVCIRDGRVTRVGQEEGFPAETAGSILEDGLGCFWIGSNRGILRVPSAELHAVARQTAARASFNVFDRDDGLGVADCSEGFQPSAMRDHQGRLWFATLDGVARVNPGVFSVNTNAPPVVIERVEYTDNSGKNRTINDPGTNALVLPAGSTDIQVVCAALTFAAPGKARYAYLLGGAGAKWVDVENRRTLYFHTLEPRAHSLRVRASNNDGVWNTASVGLDFKILPFFWQTYTFRFLLLAAMAGVGGLAAWRITNDRLRHRIVALEHQRALEKERARLASVMEATSDLVAFADSDGNILHINAAGRKLLGLPPQSGGKGMKLADLNPRPAAERLTSEGIPTARRRGTWEADTVLLHQDGHEIPVSQVIVAHKDPSGRNNFLSTIARDITERKRAEAEGVRLRSQLLQAQKMESVGRLAGGIAHDFNNMLQVILGNVALALEQAEPGSLLQTELLGIQKSANRSAALTRQLLTFARRQNASPGILDLNETIGGMLQSLQRLIGEHIQLVWTPAPNLWPVTVDPAQIDQILATLTLNARDAIGEHGKLAIETANAVLNASSASLSPDFAPGEYVLLSATDTGSGMTREVLEHLFEPFFTTKENSKSTGLGLAMVFGIVKQNKGFIQVVSEPGKGATFKIYFPRTKPSTPAELVR